MNQITTYEQKILDLEQTVLSLRQDLNEARTDIYKINRRLMWILSALNACGVAINRDDFESILAIADTLEGMDKNTIKINDIVGGDVTEDVVDVNTQIALSGTKIFNTTIILPYEKLSSIINFKSNGKLFVRLSITPDQINYFEPHGSMTVAYKLGTWTEGYRTIEFTNPQYIDKEFANYIINYTTDYQEE